MTKCMRNIAFILKSPNFPSSSAFNLVTKHNFCDQTKNSPVKDCQLIDGEQFTEPLFSIRKIVNGFNLAVYKNKYDRHFSLQNFHEGSMKAFLRLTGKLASRAYEDFRPFFTSSAYLRVKSALERLTDDQRLALFNVNEYDIKHQKILNSSFKNHVKSDTRFFAISVRFFCIPKSESIENKLMNLIQKDDKSSFVENFQKVFNDAKKRSGVIAVLEFQKQVEPNTDDDWTISYANYYYFTGL